MTTAPTVTPAQREAGLVKARQMRQQRAALLADISAGRTSPVQVLTHPDDEAARGLRVRHLVRAVPGYGPARTQAVMTAAGVHTTRRVGGLRPPQRSRLAAALRPQEKHR